MSRSLNGMVQRRTKRPISEINVVPYIDVMLVLLIIFMVTAPLITQGVKVDLPRGEAQPLDKESKPPIIATVDSEGHYYLNAQGDEDKNNLSLEELAYRVAALISLEPERTVVVRGARYVVYDQVVQLMITLQRAGVDKVGLMTDSSDDEK